MECVVSKPHLLIKLLKKLAACLTVNWESILIMFYERVRLSRLPQTSISRSTIKLGPSVIVFGIARKASWRNRWGGIQHPWANSSSYALELIKGKVYLQAFDFLFIVINVWLQHLTPTPVDKIRQSLEENVHGYQRSAGLLGYCLLLSSTSWPSWSLPLTHSCLVWFSYLSWCIFSVWLHLSSSACCLMLSALVPLMLSLSCRRIVSTWRHGAQIGSPCWTPAWAVLVSTVSCQGHLRNNWTSMGLHTGFDLTLQFSGHGEINLVKLS